MFLRNCSFAMVWFIAELCRQYYRHSRPATYTYGSRIDCWLNSCSLSTPMQATAYVSSGMALSPVSTTRVDGPTCAITGRVDGRAVSIRVVETGLYSGTNKPFIFIHVQNSVNIILCPSAGSFESGSSRTRFRKVSEAYFTKSILSIARMNNKKRKNIKMTSRTTA